MILTYYDIEVYEDTHKVDLLYDNLWRSIDEITFIITLLVLLRTSNKYSKCREK